MTFQGRVKILAGTFKTWQQLIIAAVTARTYVSAEAKTRDISMWRSQVTSKFVFKAIAGNIYTVNAWKGNNNGTVDQAAWAAGDFTASPGGGSLFDGGVEYKRDRVSLAHEIVYAAADTEIDLDVECLP